MTHPIHALTAEIQRDYDAKGWAPQLICEAWTADDLGLVISEAFHDCNDMDGPHWPTVARKVAEAIGLKLGASA